MSLISHGDEDKVRREAHVMDASWLVSLLDSQILPRMQAAHPSIGLVIWESTGSPAAVSPGHSLENVSGRRKWQARGRLQVA